MRYKPVIGEFSSSPYHYPVVLPVLLSEELLYTVQQEPVHDYLQEGGREREGIMNNSQLELTQ